MSTASNEHSSQGRSIPINWDNVLCQIQNKIVLDAALKSAFTAAGLDVLHGQEILDHLHKQRDDYERTTALEMSGNTHMLITYLDDSTFYADLATYKNWEFLCSEVDELLINKDNDSIAQILGSLPLPHSIQMARYIGEFDPGDYEGRESRRPYAISSIIMGDLFTVKPGIVSLPETGYDQQYFIDELVKYIRETSKIRPDGELYAEDWDEINKVLDQVRDKYGDDARMALWDAFYKQYNS